MKCSKCKKNNIIKAQYCKFCGKKFSEEEQKTAYQKTIFYKLEYAKDLYDKLTLSNITSHWLFRTIVLLVILSFGLYKVFINGNVMNIKESDLYQLIYNNKDKEYYLIVADNTQNVAVNLYIPNKTEKIITNHYDQNGDLIKKKSYDVFDDLLVDVCDDDYYIIKAVYSNHKSTEIKMIVYNESRVNLEEVNIE